MNNVARVGDGFHPSTTVGPLINQKGLDKVLFQNLDDLHLMFSKVDQHVKDCIAKGAVAITGGNPHSELNTTGGTFYQPTILHACSLDMIPFSDETFGPIVPFLRFKTVDEAIHIANDTK